MDGSGRQVSRQRGVGSGRRDGRRGRRHRAQGGEEKGGARREVTSKTRKEVREGRAHKPRKISIPRCNKPVIDNQTTDSTTAPGGPPARKRAKNRRRKRKRMKHEEEPHEREKRKRKKRKETEEEKRKTRTRKEEGVGKREEIEGGREAVTKEEEGKGAEDKEEGVKEG